MRLTRFEGNPILSPVESSPWECRVTTNPGAWYDEEIGRVMLLYRAAGNDPEHKIRLGLAVSEDGYHFTRASDEPVFSPGVEGFDGGCVEDPRIVKIGEWYYVAYAARPLPPGQYWLAVEDRAYNPMECPEDFPWMFRVNGTWTCLAMTKDFGNWIRAGRMTESFEDDRDVVPFPGRIGGKYYMMHRPLSRVGPEYGTDRPSIWIATSDDMLTWRDSRILIKPEFEWEAKKVGGSTPPIRTEHGWLTIYHAVGGDGHYRLGALLLDLEDPTKVLYRTRDWLLQPEEPYELDGYYPGVCFPCGKVVIGDTLFVYYGGADKYVALATCSLAELMEYVLSCPV